MKTVVILLSMLFLCNLKGENLDLTIIPYDEFMQEDPETLRVLEKALLDKGIVGIRGIPGFQEKVSNFIATNRQFSALPENVKEMYAPKRGSGDYLGFEKGKEHFQQPDGSWVIDDQKNSYYANVPNHPDNKWPRELDLQTPFQALGSLMADMGEAVMKKIGLLGPKTGIYLGDTPRLGRMLYYSKSQDSSDNPYWCGSHFDHGMFTALIPGVYFQDGIQIPEPEEAGLFVKISADGVYQKVLANDPDVLFLQVGEFGQLAMNDLIKATEHRVHKANGSVERYAMALFFDAPNEVVIHSTSQLTSDSRYGAAKGEACSYLHWGTESYKRYLPKEFAN